MAAVFYTKEGGQFHLHGSEGTLVHSSKDVAIAYCKLPNRMHVFTHGTAEGMQKWVALHNSASPHKASLKVFSQDVPTEVLNKAIQDPEYFATLL